MTVSYFGPAAPSKELFRQQLIDSPPSVIAIDAETISLKERQPIGFAIATSTTEAWYFRTYPKGDEELELIKPLLINPAITKVFHNALFDLRALPLVCAIDSSNIADTNTMARILGRTDTKLHQLSPEVGMFVESADMLLNPAGETKKKTMLDLPPEVVALKAAKDARAALALYFHYLSGINPDYFRVEMGVIPILIGMSLRGLKVNQADRAKEETRLEADVARYYKMCEEEDFNPASNQQVGYILAKRGNFLPFTKSRKRMQLKVSVDELEFLSDPVAAIVLNFREANKALTTYIRPLKDQDRIYTEYSTDIIVGRIQSSNRNMQNIPPGLRYIFEPDSGVFTSGDFSQEHLRILMYFSGDEEMQRVYYDGVDGGDIHIRSAKGMGITRRLAKTINYAIPYGATARTVSLRTKIKDEMKCSRFLDLWFDTYRGAAEWIREAQDYALAHSKSLPTLFGRQITIPEEFTKYGKLDREAMKRKGVNYPILGSDGEVMKRALIKCKHLPLALTVHDSIACDGDVEFPVEELESIAPVRIPFEVTKTQRWE